MPDEYDEIGPWSEVKLEILRKYLAPYSQLVSAKGFYHLYIDALAGPGQHKSRSTGALVEGSPMIALGTTPPFREYHFVEQNAARVEQLRSLAGDRRDAHVHNGDCHEILTREILPRVDYRQNRRALCLLDPYNIELSWDLVRQIGQMRSVEIFLNFMIMDMNMNVLLGDPGHATARQIARANRFWGDDSWRGVAYDTQGNLFGYEEKVYDANDKIAEAYRRRLLEVAGFRYAPRPLPMKNRLGRTIYYLYFASPNETGHHIVEDIFERYR
jgi:three-Cys-motif partner protein